MHAPARAVDHHRQPRHLGLGRDHVQERAHRLLALEQVGVHVHVERVRAAAHLLERDLDRAGEVARLDEAAEARRAGDVRALADQDEAGVRADLERLEPAPVRRGAPAPAARAARAPRTAAAIAAVWSGPEPQQLPATFRRPASRELAAAACS